MKAVRIHAYGGPDHLKFEDVPNPEPGPEEVLVRVHAAGVNPVDAAVREGKLGQRLFHQLPLIPGWDVAGTVEYRGEGGRKFGPGDQVYGRADIRRDGTYAEFVLMRTVELALMPEILNFVQAASLPTPALAAWQCLVEAADLKEGQTVLIHGAAGGVGHLALQLARWRHARVIAVAHKSDLAYLESLGADEVVDYDEVHFEKAVDPVDVVLDTLGGEIMERSWQVLKPGGLLVSLVDRPPAAQARKLGVRALHVSVQADAGQLTKIASLVDDRQLTPLVAKVFPLAEAAKAHREIEGHGRGRVVLQVVKE